MKRSLMRPTAALFPIALLAAALLGDAYTSAGILGNYIIIQLFSLCSVEAFRNAAAREPGVRRVDRRFSGTWLMLLLGIAAHAVLGCFVYGREAYLNEEIYLLIPTVCIIIEQLFEERMFALSHSSDGSILSVVANVLLFTGLMIDSSAGVSAPVQIPGFFAICGTGLGMIISIAASYIIEPMHAFSLVPRSIGFFPKACVQSLLYLLSAILWMARGNCEDVLAGMILWRLSRTICRRARDESRPLNLLLVTVSASMIIANIWIPGIEKYTVAVIVATILAVVVFCAPSWRIYVGTVLIGVAFELLIYDFFAEDMWNMIAVMVCSVIAIILNIHKAFLKKV